VHYAEIPGTGKMAHVDEGAGEKTLLFIHGLANYSMVWKKNIDYLKQHYRCIAVDLPGNGLSDRGEYPFTMQFFADSIISFIAVMKLKNVSIVGHSMGGQIAVTAALKKPDCAQALILCAPAGFEVFSTLERTMFHSSIHLMDFFSSEEQSLRHTIENSFYRHHRQGEDVIVELTKLMKTYKLQYYRKMIETCIKSMLSEPVFEQLNRVPHPTLVIFGKNDAMIPNKLLHHTSTEQLAKDSVKRMPAAMLELLPDCGHFLQWEKPEDVNRNIIIFLEEGLKHDLKD